MSTDSENSIMIVAVNYFGHGHLRDYIKSLETQSFRHWHLVIADNSADADEWVKVETAASTSDNVSAIDIGYNAGYVGALREVARRVPLVDYSWVVLSNTDLYMGSTGSLASLSKLSRPSLGMVGPRITSLDNDSNLNPHLIHRPREKDVRRRSLMFRNRFTAQSSVYAAYYFKKYVKRGARSGEYSGVDCYAVHGSWFALSREYLADPLALDYPVWLFGEELHFAESCWNRGLSVEYRRDIEVFHHEHAQTGVRRSAPLLDGMIAATAHYSRIFREARAGEGPRR